MEKLLESTLLKYWGYTSFRPVQKEVILSIMNGRDTLVLMPTGGGKSILYQVPTMISEEICIVITPLISLMKDQVDRLCKLGISAVAIHSGLSHHDIERLLDNCTYGDVKFMYVAPERLSSEDFRARLPLMNISLIAVDEAHCISQWGNDFRPSYKAIGELRDSIENNPPILALTASATHEVQEDIMDSLHFIKPNIIRSSFSRPNLTYVVRNTEDKKAEILHILTHTSGSAIVYTRRRELTEEVSAFLEENGISSAAYHAGLLPSVRAVRQQQWISNEKRVMVATSAFGMGIDKPDVRCVIHYSVCDSLESYYQEAGRAGRDGKRSYAVLLNDKKSQQLLLQQVTKTFPSVEKIIAIYDHICSYLQIAYGDGKGHAFKFDLEDFSSKKHIYPTEVVNALKILNQNGYVTYIEEMSKPTRIIFSVTRDQLYHTFQNKKEENILDAILRKYNGVFTQWRSISEQEIAFAASCSEADVTEFLKKLRKSHIIDYVPINTSSMIYMDEERLDEKNVYISYETYTQRKDTLLRRANAMIAYANEPVKCRSLIIEEYFEGKEPKECGCCDNCLQKKKAQNMR